MGGLSGQNWRRYFLVLGVSNNVLWDGLKNVNFNIYTIIALLRRDFPCYKHLINESKITKQPHIKAIFQR
jgi:hypothetical protein